MTLACHPCGKVVDYIRDPYRAEMKPWNDRDDTVTVRWFRVPRENGFVGGPSPYRSSYWYDPNDYVPPGAGELPSRTYGSDRGEDRIGFLPGGLCGEADVWERGGEYDSDPHIETDEDGSAPCCVVAPMRAVGGQQQGTAPFEIMTAQGGQQQYGAAQFFPRPMRAVGGQQQGKVPPPPRVLASGGQRQGGTPTFNPPHGIVADGGQRQGGTAVQAPANRLYGTGGQRQGGAAAQAPGPGREIMTAAGGQRQGGAAAFVTPTRMYAAGGQSQGGAVEYGPVGTVPTSCCGSTLVPATLKAIITGAGSVNGTYVLTWAGSGTQHWDYTGPFGTCSFGSPTLVVACGGLLTPVWQFQFNPGLSTVNAATVHCAAPFSLTFTGVSFAACGGGTGSVTVVGV